MCPLSHLRCHWLSLSSLVASQSIHEKVSKVGPPSHWDLLTLLLLILLPLWKTTTSPHAKDLCCCVSSSTLIVSKQLNWVWDYLDFQNGIFQGGSSTQLCCIFFALFACVTTFNVSPLGEFFVLGVPSLSCSSWSMTRKSKVSCTSFSHHVESFLWIWEVFEPPSSIKLTDKINTKLPMMTVIEFGNAVFWLTGLSWWKSKTKKQIGTLQHKNSEHSVRACNDFKNCGRQNCAPQSCVCPFANAFVQDLWCCIQFAFFVCHLTFDLCCNCTSEGC